MSKLKELIDRLCPDGVEYCPLGRIASIPAERVNIKRLPNSLYVGVENLIKDKGGMRPAIELPAVHDVIKFKLNDILIGNIRPYLKKIWLADQEGGTNGDVILLRINNDIPLIPKFLYYIISSDSFFSFHNQYAKGAKMPRGDKKKILEFPIPVPPIVVQEEIVKILDRFSDYAAELQAELQARKEQYEYYRNLLLTFNPSAYGCGTDGEQEMRDRENTPPHLLTNVNVIWKTMGEICSKICSGGTPSTSVKSYYNGNIPWMRTQEVDWTEVYETEMKITEEAIRNSSAKMIPENCVIIAMYGATAAKCCINKIPLTTNQACCNLQINPQIADYRYVYQYICNEYNNLKAMGEGSQSNINASKIKNYRIPIPPLEIQEKIVAILDRFETLVNDLTKGLPAEIAAIKEQYEYYRNKLLTFKQRA